MVVRKKRVREKKTSLLRPTFSEKLRSAKDLEDDHSEEEKEKLTEQEGMIFADIR